MKDMIEIETVSRGNSNLTNKVMIKRSSITSLKQVECNNIVPDSPHVEIKLEGAETHLIRGKLHEVAKKLF